MALESGARALTERSGVCKTQQETWKLAEIWKTHENSTESKRGQEGGGKSQKSCRTGRKLVLSRRNIKGKKGRDGKTSEAIIS